MSTYGSFRIISCNTNRFSFENGTRPCTKQYNVTPIDQISAALPDIGSLCSAEHNSGGINAGLPAVDFKASSPFMNISDTPKSTILRILVSDNSKLSGLISRIGEC